jgi:hypothetical protein
VGTLAIGSTNDVEVILINWKRPGNIIEIVRGLRNQTRPCTITICDCHPTQTFALPSSIRDDVDRIYRWQHNTGPYSRYVPIGAFDHEFTFFLDDDMVPGSLCIEHFIDAAARAGSFGVLGQLGRILSAEGKYTGHDVARRNSFVEVDVIVRGFFVRTINLSKVLQFRWKIFPPQADLSQIEDDLLLCVALKMSDGLSSYLTPADNDIETRINKLELPTPHALQYRPDHRHRRESFLSQMTAIGWRSINVMTEPAARDH